MQELHHHKLESAITSYDEERPQTRAIRTSAVETAFGLPAAQQLAQKARYLVITPPYYTYYACRAAARTEGAA